MKLANRLLTLMLLAALAAPAWLMAQTAAPGTISLPTFTRSFKVGGRDFNYTLLGGDPAKGGTTTIPVVLVPVTLTIDSPMNAAGKKAVLDAAAVAPKVEHSPIFMKFPFASGATQYADALMRTDFYSEKGIANWHTLLGKPTVTPLKIEIPVGKGYVLTSKKTGRMLAMVDAVFVQREIFKQLPAADITGKLVIAYTRDTTYYVTEDATVCCSWGAHGVDTSAGNRQPFVLGSYLDSHTVAMDDDIQPITQQLEQVFRDPLHDPLAHGGRGVAAPGNAVPSWTRVPPMSQTELPRNNSGCGGGAISIQYFMNDPTDVNWKNTTSASKPFVATLGGVPYHLQNAALLQWYNEMEAPTSYHGVYSFPDATALKAAAKPCPMQRRPGGGGGANNFGAATAAPVTSVQPVPMGAPNGHKLIGYWSGLGTIRDVSPQWDIIIVAFATPVREGPQGTMQYAVRGSMTEQQFIDDIKYKHSQGKKVMISLGGGGVHFVLDTEAGKQNFIKSVEAICEKYGFDGIDIDFESPSIDLNPGDNDFKHPTTPGMVNMIAGLHAIHDHFGPSFMLSLVPEGTQTSAAYPGYGGQFGSYITLLQGVRDILTFSDTQDYNCPPIEGLDGEFYMPGSVDYHAAATELLLQGFNLGRDPKYHFDPVPADKLAIGYLNSDTTPEIVEEAMRYLITGKTKAPVTYKLRKAGGYPGFIGAMFWTIDADRREDYRYSNTVGPLLHSLPDASTAKK